MRRLPYVITKKAVSDLEEIWLYTVEKWSVAQADRYYSLIFDEIDYICTNINTGKSMDHVQDIEQQKLNHISYYIEFQMKLSRLLEYCMNEWILIDA